MKKLSILLAILAVSGLVVFACGDDGDKKAHCETIVLPCNGECDVMTEACCDGTCTEYVMCDPTCDADTEMCDVCSGTCETIPDDPCEDVECAAGEYCENGKCKELPVCDPACAADEYCTW